MEKVKIVIDKIKAVPEKKALAIGFILIFFSSLFFPYTNWIAMVIGGLSGFFAVFFILSAADKRQARIGKK